MCGPRPLGLPRQAEGLTRSSPGLGPTAGGAPVCRYRSGHRERPAALQRGGVGGSQAAIRPNSSYRPPSHPAPVQVRNLLPSGGERSFKGALKRIGVPRTLPRAGGRGGRETERGGDAQARGGSPKWTPGLGSSGPPRAWLSRLPVSACPVPAPARRSLAVVPSPAPRPLSSSLDSAWGFAGFWEIKTASNSGGALPGQTGPGGPCAPGYRPRAGAPGFGGPGEGAAGRGPGTQAPVMPPASQSRGPILEVSGSGRGAASVSRPGRREWPGWRDRLLRALRPRDCGSQSL